MPRASVGHASIERHVLTEVHEIGRRFIQAYLDWVWLFFVALGQGKPRPYGCARV